MPARSQINLLTTEDFRSTVLGKVSTWALSIGRWIVIITELIVILAFMARFKLDRDNSNLIEDINQKQAVIKAFSDFETIFRQTQTRLSTLSQATSQQKNVDLVLAELGKSIPTDVALVDVQLENGEIVIRAVAITEPGMAGMEQLMTQSSVFKQVSLVRVDIEDSFKSGIEFEIHAKLTV